MLQAVLTSPAVRTSSLNISVSIGADSGGTGAVQPAERPPSYDEAMRQQPEDTVTVARRVTLQRCPSDVSGQSE